MKLRNILCLASFACAALTVHAQSVMSPAASKSALRIFALGQVRQGDVNAYASSETQQVTSWSVGFSPGFGAASIAQTMVNVATKLRVSVANPSHDYVSVWADLNDADGDQLFYAGGSVNPVASGGGYYLPTIPLVFELAYYIPIPVGDDIASAEIFVDAAGGYDYTQGSVPLIVSDGKLYFESDLAGKGVVVLTTNEGAKFAYDLTQNGAPQVPIPTFSPATTAAFDGIESVTFPASGQIIDRQLESNSGVGENLSFEVNRAYSIFPYEWLYMDVYTTEHAVPLGYWFKSPGNSDWVYYARYNDEEYVGIPIYVGTTYIIPDWDESQFREADPVLDDGGKG